MPLECERCGITCKTAKYLAKHQRTSKYCQKYQDIIFVCRRCNFHTKGIKTIEAHSKECDVDNKLKDPFAGLINSKQLAEDEKRVLKIRSTQMESKIKKNEMEIMNLQLKLQFERMKNRIYTQIIESQTDIKLENIIQEFENEVHIFNFKKGKIPLVVHDFVDETSEKTTTEKITLEPPLPKPKKKRPKKKRVNDPEPEIQFVIEECDNEDGKPPDKKIKVKKSVTKEKKKKKNKTYRKVTEYIKVTQEELDDKLQKDVERVDKEIGKIVYNNFDVSHKEITDEIDELMAKIENSRVYTYNLDAIKQKRNRLLGKLNLEKYVKLVEKHTKRLSSIFKDKNKSRKDIVKNVSKSMSPLDMRLIFYGGYTNCTIEVDDVQRFGMALDILTEHKKQFVPYDKLKLFGNIKNYGLALFELRECIERSIFNRYGFHNVIYAPRPKSKSNDPYSFYSLEKISGENRCWTMECRLEDFTIDFIDHTLQFCVSLFRKIYRDVFNDNTYRSDYMGKSQVTEFDCEQLIQNIIKLSRPIELCRVFQDIVISKCTFTPTETDKFNLYGDDRLQQKRFVKAKDNPEDSQRIIKMLFDGISTEDAIEILASR